jgi:hypothetical protein
MAEIKRGSENVFPVFDTFFPGQCYVKKTVRKKLNV